MKTKRAMRTSTVKSPIGPLRLVADEKGLVSLDFIKSENAKSADKKWVSTPAFFKPMEKALEDFFSKRKNLKRFTYGNRGGTEFQRAVWREIEKIPFGETRSYGEIAEAVGAPRAARAVGSACGKNPIPLFVPCHRVLGAHGKLGGYTSGLDIKKKLLKLEGVL